MASTNAISILIEARDNASRVVAQAADNVRGAAGKASEANDKLAASSDKSQNSFIKTGAIMGAVAGVAQTVVSRAFDMVTDSIDNAVSRVDTLNNFPRVMSNFGVSAADSTKMIQELDKGVRGLPTTLNDIASLAQGFVPVTKNTEEATQTALALNNAILAGGAPMQVQAAAMEQFRQALSKGVPDLQDWKSLEMAMPAQLQQTAEKLGIGNGALKDYTKNGLGLYNAMKDGKISMEDFNTALINLNQNGINGLPNFAQQAKNSTQGIATGFTNMKTAVTRGIADIIQAIGSQNISNVLTEIGKGFESAAKWGAQFIGVAVELGRRLGDATSPAFDRLYKTVSENLMPTLTKFWKEVIVPLLPALGQLLVSAINYTVTSFNGFLTVVSGVVQFITQHKDVIGPVLKAAVEIAKGAFDVATIAVKFFWDMLSAVGNWVIQNAAWLAPLIGALGGLVAALAMQAAFNAFTAGLVAIQTVTIPAVAGQFAALSALIAAPMVMPAITVAAAIASLMAVKQAADQARSAIDQADAMRAQSTKASVDLMNTAKTQYQAGKISKSEFDRLMNLASHASGTSFAPGGLTLVGENGPELVNMPRGSRVYNSDDSRRMMQQTTAPTITIQFLGTVNMRSDQDVQSLAQQINQSARLNRLGMAA